VTDVIDHVERARRMDAALAEIGYPVGTAKPNHELGTVLVGARVALAERWKAFQVAGIPGPEGWVCRRCYALAEPLNGIACFPIWRRCEAVAPFTEDCEVTA